MFAFIAQVAWQERAGGWGTVLGGLLLLAIVGAALGGVFCLNQYAVRTELEPRRQELDTLPMSLADEVSDAS